MAKWLPIQARFVPVLALLACGSAETTAPLGGSASAIAAASASALAAAEADRPVPPGAREGSTIARAPESDILVVASEDHQALDLIKLPIHDESRPVHVATPGRPAQVAVIGSRVLVSVREMPDGSGALLVYERSGAGSGSTELGEPVIVSLPADAWGLAVSPDGTRALVTSAWTAKVSLVDLQALKSVWTRDVAREPRGATFLADGETAFVSHLVDAPLTRIDRIGSEATVTRVELPASPVRSPPLTRLPASLGYALVLSPERDRLFVARHALGALGSDVWFGTAAVDVLDTATSLPVGTAHQANAPSMFLEAFSGKNGRMFPWWGAASTVITEGGRAFVQPRAVVYRKTQQTLLVASEGTDELVELDAMMSDPTLGVVRTFGLAAGGGTLLVPASHGGAPSGIALSADENTAYVHCRSTDELAVIHLPRGEGRYVTAPPSFVKLADAASDESFAIGRRFFYDARDGYISGGLACAGCHPEGRDDGFVWHEVEFGEGKEGFSNFFGSASAARHMAQVWQGQVKEPTNVDATGGGFARQTPMLVGRLKAPGPYGWLGENKDLSARLTAGFRLHRWNAAGDGTVVENSRAMQLMSFVRTGLVPPPIPKRALTPEEERGRVIFTSASSECATCHVPETDYTNRSLAMFADVAPRQAFVQEKGVAYKTPSLLFVGGSAPYFHDGRYATLEELVEKNGDRMGKTSHLDAEGKKALVAFLKTL